MIKARINHAIETVDIGLEIDFSTIPIEARETLKIFLALPQLNREIFHGKTHTANRKMIRLTFLVPADLKNNRRLVSDFTSINLHKNKNHWSSNVVRFTTTDDSLKEMSYPFQLNF